MPPSKFAATARKSQQSRRALLKKVRLARQQLIAAASTQTPPVSPPPSSPPSPSPVADSASKRKLASYGEIVCDENTDSVSYVIVDMCMMRQLFTTLLCPTCKTASLTVAHREQAHMGMAVELTVGCTSCHEGISECTSSQRMSSRKFDVNRRISLAFTSVGLGHAGLASFCEVMGMRSISKSTFQDHKMELETAASVAKSKLLAETHQIVRDAYLSSGMAATDDDDIINVSVSYDGSWHKRGFTSHHGVGCVIDSVTGLVVDYEAVSRYCQVCSTSGDKLKASPSEYDEWWETHKNVCEVNHQGSSGLMEVTAAKILWQRSLEHKMRYTTMISDGDSKTYTELVALAPYGKNHAVKKEECINHFSKRLGTALRRVVACEKAKGVTLGGMAALHRTRWLSCRPISLEPFWRIQVRLRR